VNTDVNSYGDDNLAAGTGYPRAMEDQDDGDVEGKIEHER